MGCTIQTGPHGLVNDRIVDHYKKIAQSGTALIVIGHVATSPVYPATLLRDYSTTKTRMWGEEHVDGLLRLTNAVHSEGAKIVVQLTHPGMRAAVDTPPAPSPFLLPLASGGKECHVMSLEDIRVAEEVFWNAARIAALAGFDGAEVHASNGWMVNNFTNRCINRREDAYGKDEMLIVKEIFDGIRNTVADDFVVGVRMAGFNPDLETGLRQGKRFEEIGFDYISLCNNSKIKWSPQEHYTPENYTFSSEIYSAAEIKKVVRVPVLCAGNIRTTADAEAVLAETDIDMVLIGRGMLADPFWTKKAFDGSRQIVCRACPHCTWKLGGENCAAIDSVYAIQKERDL